MRRSHLQTLVGRALMIIRAARMRPTGFAKRISETPASAEGRRTHAHRDLDAAVAAAYGGPADTSEDEALTKLLELKLSRAAPVPRTANSAEG
jgi:hypothetical protein